MQKHFLRLEDCPRDKARQYLIIRSRKKAHSVYMLHIIGKVQGLKLLTKIPKSALNFHQLGQFDPGNLDSLENFLSQHVREVLRAVTEFIKRQKSDLKVDSRSPTSEIEHKIPQDKKRVDRNAYVKSWRAKKKREKQQSITAS